MTMMNFAHGVRNAISCRRSIASKYKNVVRGISMSGKTGEVGTADTLEAEAKQVQPKKKIRHWQTYGFDIVDQRKDYFTMQVFALFGIVGTLWGGIFIMSYYPDMRDLAWASREARIQVRKREILGLPLVDKNYVDPALIKLPPDEEIPQEDIII